MTRTGSHASLHLALVAACLALSPNSFGQDTLKSPLPLDPLVKTGTLENGLRYFIRENTEPAARLEMRLVVNAGSVLEDDDQRGLAHFVEHMLFNGTRHFPRQTLVEFFEHIGMRFGPDVNAYTSFDETVYMIQVPTDSLPAVHRAFEVIKDWAMHATMDHEEVDLERGVLVEEWRRGRGAAGRTRDQILPLLLRGSRYADRLPIGDTLTLKRSPYAAIQRFYDTWYRPDLMAVVLVGDLPAAHLEQLVLEHLAGLKAPPDPRPRLQHALSSKTQMQYQVIQDHETTVTSFTVYYRQLPKRTVTSEDIRTQLLGQLAIGMLNRRLAAIARDGTRSPFLWVRLTRNALVRHHSAFALAGQVHEDSLHVGLESALRELARATRHGFATEELSRQKRVILAGRERAYSERHHTPSAALARQLVHHFLTGTAAPGIDFEHELVQTLLPSITARDVDAFLRDALNRDDQVYVVTMPDKPGLAPVTAQELKAAAARVQAETLAPFQDHAVEGPFMASIPAPGGVVSTREEPDLGITEVTLGNGVRVLMKPTDFKADEVLFTAYSNGGTSLYSDEDYFDATLADLIVQRSGAGDFDQNSLRQKLAGKVVAVNSYVTELTEGFSGRASRVDLETLFQLVHLYATRPRADEAALRSFQNHQRAQLINRQANPASAFSDSLYVAFYGNHARRRLLTIDDIDSLSTEKSLAFFRERFADFGDFTFIFVGSFQVDQLVALARTYLGTLPSQGRQESWRDVEPELPEGAVTKVAYKGQEPKSRVGIVFHGPFAYSRVQDHRLQSLQMVLNMRIREELREARGGIYSASVQAGAVRLPRPQYTFSIYFGCAPERVDELTRAVFDEIEKIKSDAPLADYVARVKEQQRQAHRVRLETNSFWLAALQQAYRHDESLLPVLHYEDLISTLGPDDIREAARSWLVDRYIQVKLMPGK